jgi:hypothetical protein
MVVSSFRCARSAVVVIEVVNGDLAFYQTDTAARVRGNAEPAHAAILLLILIV